jgi:hypothetical protein
MRIDFALVHTLVRVMARITLYVPDDLKTRMDAAGDAINWSEVARPVLTAAVAAFEHRKGQNMTTAIERLRASRLETEQTDKVQGKSDGRAWAENDAEYQWLKRLHLRANEQTEEEPMTALAMAIDPTGTTAFSEISEICFSEVSDLPSDEYLDGFINGAVEFFKEVRSRVEAPADN